MATRTKEREEFLAEVITSAVEGGTGYWAQVSQYQYTHNGELHVYCGEKVEGEIASATLVDMEDEKEYTIRVDDIARGIGRIRHEDAKINSTIRKSIMHADIDNDAGEIDADGADCIVQFAVFSELVYG